MTPRVSLNDPTVSRPREIYPLPLRSSVYNKLKCDQYYQGTTGNPINGSVSIDQMCNAIKQNFSNQLSMSASIKAAYIDSCANNLTYQIPLTPTTSPSLTSTSGHIRYNNLYRIMTSRLNLQP